MPAKQIVVVSAKQIVAFEVAVRGAEAVIESPILLPLVASAAVAVAASGRSTEDLAGAKLFKTLRGSDGGRWDVTVVRDAHGAWCVAAVETIAAAAALADQVDFVGDVVFLSSGEEIQVAA